MTPRYVVVLRCSVCGETFGRVLEPGVGLLGKLGDHTARMVIDRVIQEPEEGSEEDKP